MFRYVIVSKQKMARFLPTIFSIRNTSQYALRNSLKLPSSHQSVFQTNLGRALYHCVCLNVYQQLR